ncbi:MAG TPA: hypothetical protein DEA47_05610 [Peptococcaceae bacterium]|nr:hypothetical protein [Peptococcaceae bacterium]
MYIPIYSSTKPLSFFENYTIQAFNLIVFFTNFLLIIKLIIIQYFYHFYAYYLKNKKGTSV